MTRPLTLLGLAAALLTPSGAWAQTPPPTAAVPVTVTLDTARPGAAIPDDFSGLSFEMERALPDAGGHYFFRPDNAPAVTLFQSLGVKSLRLGGNTADRSTLKAPAPADLDSVFGFARAAGVKVLYTLRLRQGDPAASAVIAKYIWDHDRAGLYAFALGNEPSGYIKTGYPTYKEDWQTYVGVVTAPGVAPGAQFSGPGATAGTTSWTRSLAADFAKSGHLAFVTQHYYAFGPGTKVSDPAAGRDAMLAAGTSAQYEKFYRGFGPAARQAGTAYRLEEVNNYYFGGVKDVSDTFAAALWGLDSLYWWASHEAAGVNFHAGDQVARGDTNVPCWYSPFWTAPDGVAVHPLGYGLAAFNVGGHGRLVPATASPDADQSTPLNMTTYAVLASDRTLYVTLINKEHGPGARAAVVTLDAGAGAKPFRSGQVMFLTAPGGDVAAKTGVTLGGGAFGPDGRWRGQWSPLPAPAVGGDVAVMVPAAAAAVVRLTAP